MYLHANLTRQYDAFLSRWMGFGIEKSLEGYCLSGSYAFPWDWWVWTSLGAYYGGRIAGNDCVDGGRLKLWHEVGGRASFGRPQYKEWRDANVTSCDFDGIDLQLVACKICTSASWIHHYVLTPKSPTPSNPHTSKSPPVRPPIIFASGLSLRACSPLLS